ncbi:mRNA processing protein, putative [Plasmodium sp. gorilla clade G2]|uniref:mRNA processing protein, putative n=1 Tax=Plasmodium sp. gorilla clade G2 TaxID=880535 RepID=UPI000D21710E|nr:mRNA processing protein, putative [Plasmodium sp. gorilla clade G2]SOV14503.1 mRNA processing protein, putative [Plasmodium sp. gorilla clade G2]
MTNNKNPNYSLWVGNIPFDITENELYEILSKVGVVKNVRIKYDVDKNISKGFAFCEYKDVETCLLAFKYINGYEIKGRKLKVFWANEEYKDKYGNPTSHNNNNNDNDNLKGNNLCDNNIKNIISNNNNNNNNNNVTLFNTNNLFMNNSKNLIKNKHDKKKVRFIFNEDDTKQEKDLTNIHNENILNNKTDKSNMILSDINNDNFIKVNISNIVHTLTTSQIIYILSYFKKLALNNGQELKYYLQKNKNITYALLHSLFILNIINDHNDMDSLDVYANYDSILNKKERIMQMHLSNISLDYKKNDINKRERTLKGKNNNNNNNMMAQVGSNKYFMGHMKEAQSTGVYKMDNINNMNNMNNMNNIENIENIENMNNLDITNQMNNNNNNTDHNNNNNNIVVNKSFKSKKKEQNNFLKSKCATSSTLYNNKKKFIHNSDSMNRSNYYDKGMNNINNRKGSSFISTNNSNLSLYNNMRKKKKKKRDYKNAEGSNKNNDNHNFSQRDDYSIYKKKKLYNDKDSIGDIINDDIYNMNNMSNINNMNNMSNIPSKGLYQNVFHANTTTNNDNRKNEQFLDENNYDENNYCNIKNNVTYDHKINDIADYMYTQDKKNNIHNMNNLYPLEKNKTNGNIIKDMKKKANKTVNTNMSKDTSNNNINNNNNNNNNNAHMNPTLYKNNQNNEHVVLDDIYSNIDLPDEELVNEVIKNTDILNNILKSKIENMKLWNNEQRIQVLSIQKALQLKGYTLK